MRCVAAPSPALRDVGPGPGGNQTPALKIKPTRQHENAYGSVSATASRLPCQQPGERCPCSINGVVDGAGVQTTAPTLAAGCGGEGSFSRIRFRKCYESGEASDVISPDILHLLSPFGRIVSTTLSPARVTLCKFATPLKNGCHIATAVRQAALSEQPP